MDVCVGHYITSAPKLQPFAHTRVCACAAVGVETPLIFGRIGENLEQIEQNRTVDCATYTKNCRKSRCVRHLDFCEKKVYDRGEQTATFYQGAKGNVKKLTKAEVAEQIRQKLNSSFSHTPETASDELFYQASAQVLTDIMSGIRADFEKRAVDQERKQVCYLCMEFLLGRSLRNTLYNLNLESAFRGALKELGADLDTLYELEPDAGLGNGGLGRLAACILDGLATGEYPAMGYSIKYEFGIFRQKLVDGWQMEMPDFWLPGGEVWFEERPELALTVNFDGYVDEWWDNGFHHVEHRNATAVKATPSDMMIAGKDGKAVSVLRLWTASAPGFDMSLFNQGEYLRAVEQNAMAEVISKVLYPADNHAEGKSLRLRQQYFLLSASIQDIIRRHLQIYGSLDSLPDRVAIHINDTHPALCVPELMRIMMDECGLSWDDAWSIVNRTVAYTNHTVMKEALECWGEDMFRHRLPRIYQIVKEIDRRFRGEVLSQTGDPGLCHRV
ncbi:MAG: glycogen/starch/alpha-glucan phosphorylase, partial [Clostridia bacterium]|nr:glycogen/starch/alpha-glucan phosphorylase [Clostridia bacterium]